MITYQQILEDSNLESAFWRQFVTEGMETLVVDHLGRGAVVSSKAPRFVDIPLENWDGLTGRNGGEAKLKISEELAAQVGLPPDGRPQHLLAIAKEVLEVRKEREAKFQREDEEAQRRREERRNAAIKNLRAILKEHNMEISVDGCGCCDSPGFRFVLNGEVIVDEDNFNFDSRKEKQQ